MIITSEIFGLEILIGFIGEGREGAYRWAICTFKANILADKWRR